MTGSSPLARGTRDKAWNGLGDVRLIPARAGNTSWSGNGRCAETAHPRSRGEHRKSITQKESHFGSSPLARGTRVARAFCLHLLRLIPARAGNTLIPSLNFFSAAAHPRSRGEHSPCSGQIESLCGSSPLARGTRRRFGRTVRRSRLIPARAGNTSLAIDAPMVRAAHPRSRGEHRATYPALQVHLGSSPLARGTHLLTWGFTPYTGKIGLLWSQSLHPEYTISSHY